MLDFLKNLFSSQKSIDSDSQEDFDPRRSGSLIVAVGGPGTGKTLLTFRLALRAAFDAGLPFIAEDPNGDIGVYHSAAVERLKSQEKLSERDQELLDYITDTSMVRVYSKENAPKFAAIVEKYRKRASSSKRVRKPTLFALIDEGGVMRRDSEAFWNMGAAFRNAGITAYTTIHKDTDVSRVGRQAIRAVILFRGYEGTVEFFGKEIDASQCTAPMSNKIVYMDSHDRELKTWDAGRNWDDPPFSLVAPVQPTNVNKELVKV
jgi:hypothetical protein